MPKTPSIHEVLQALEWVRLEMMRTGSPDFIRQRELEGPVQRLCRLLLTEHEDKSARWPAKRRAFQAKSRR